MSVQTLAPGEVCQAMVSVPPWYLRSYRCTKPAKYEMAGAHVCGIHKRVVLRWELEGRATRMVKSQWGVA